MKKILSLFAGIVFARAIGTSYADEPGPGSMDTGDKMIRNDDLKRYNFDQDRGTFNVTSGRSRVRLRRKRKNPRTAKASQKVLPGTRKTLTTEHRSRKPIVVHWISLPVPGLRERESSFLREDRSS
ncbi:MAG: hypothetical protein ACYC7L_13365 [Nitrospirota bacterium]